MGNCCTVEHHQKPEPTLLKVQTDDRKPINVYQTAAATKKQQRGGENWDSVLPIERREKMEKCEEKWESDEGGKGATRREVVKVKITKQQLEELMRKIDVKGLTVNQLLGHLMNVSESYEMMMMRSWRPRLESIPEI